MKKKGLIISTIVMVVVLVASLTTATYAWFTTTSATAVQGITVSAASGAEIKIGVLASQLNYNAAAVQDSFRSGQVTMSASGATGGQVGLGSDLNTQLTLDTIAKATGMGSATEWTEDATATNVAGHYYILDGAYIECPKATAPEKTYTRGSTGSAAKLTPSAISGSVVKASGNGDTVDANSIEAAVANTDYLHFTLGLAASVENVASIKLILYVNPTDSKTTIGITAGLHFDYKVDGGSWVEGSAGDVYGSEVSYEALKKTSTTGTAGNAASTIGADLGTADETILNDGWKKIEITINPNANGKFTVNTEIHQVEFYIYYDGVDSDCVTSALGSSCQVAFMVTNTKVA